MFLGSLSNDDGDGNGNENGKKSNRVRISAIKFEAAQLYFLSNVFVAVAVVVAQAPYQPEKWNGERAQGTENRKMGTKQRTGNEVTDRAKLQVD